jgi:hypothetical protein
LSRRELGRGDPQQTIAGAVGLSIEQRAHCIEEARRKLRRLDPGSAARAKTEVGQPQFQGHPARGEVLLAQPRSDAVAVGEQDAGQLGLIADVAVESRLARNAFGFALRIDGAIVASLGQPP